jgi:hypothetical protein
MVPLAKQLKRIMTVSTVVPQHPDHTFGTGLEEINQVAFDRWLRPPIVLGVRAPSKRNRIFRHLVRG